MVIITQELEKQSSVYIKLLLYGTANALVKTGPTHAPLSSSRPILAVLL